MRAQEISELVRVPVAVPVEIQIDNHRVELLEAAHSALGYTGHTAVMQQQKLARTHREQLVAFKAICEKLGIEPYSRKTVERYKAKKVHQADRKYWLRNYVNSEWGHNAMFYSGLYGVTVGVVDVIVQAATSETNKIPFGQYHPQIFYSILCSCVLAIAYWWTSAAIRNLVLDKRMFRHRWEPTNLFYYPNLVPDFALSHAVELAHAASISKDQFFVERLVVNATDANRLSFDPDPFLTVRHAGQVFYLDVWDERDFERETESGGDR